MTVNGVRGNFGSFGEIQGNPGQTTLRGFALKNIDVQLKDPKLTVDSSIDLNVENVTVNNQPFVLSRARS